MIVRLRSLRRSGGLVRPCARPCVRARAFGAFAALAVACAVVSAAPSARADEAAARAHFKRGVSLYDEKRFPEALEEFRAAYREKPSAGIKQNIALSQKGMGKLADAATSLDEALDEGKATFSPEKRAAIERELAELATRVATIRIRLVGSSADPAAPPKPIEGGTVTVDGKPLPDGALSRPIRLEPGIHVFTAHKDGFGDPPEKHLALLAGSPVDATFVMGATYGSLTIRPSTPDAVVKVDGEEKGKGDWTGKVAEGSHHIEVSAPGFKTTIVDVPVGASATVVYPVTLYRPGQVPPPYEAPDRKPTAMTKTFYAGPMGALETATYRTSAVLDEPPSGTRHDSAGAAIGVKGGWRMSRFFALELHTEIGGTTARYKIHPNDPNETKVTFGHWQVTPVVRFTSPGRVRFTTGIGFGLHGTSVSATLGDRANLSKKGSSVSTSFLIDFGGQIDAGPVFFEPVLFFDIHGIASVRDRDSGERLLQASPSSRAGVRLGLGIPF